MNNPKENTAWKMFAHNIKWLRKQCEFSEDRMAEILGISVDMLKAIEHSELPEELTCEIIERIHIVFGIDAVSLWEHFSEN